MAGIGSTAGDCLLINVCMAAIVDITLKPEERRNLLADERLKLVTTTDFQCTFPIR